MSGTGVISEIIDKVSFATYLPLLSSATADNNDATPGYMFEEINDISFQPNPNCQQLTDYLTRRLERPSACVKLKVLKIIFYLVKNGHPAFRQCLRRSDGSIKIATMYSGVPDPMLGTSPYEMVRKTAQDLLDLLFDPEEIKKDDAEDGVVATQRTKSYMGGLGSNSSQQGKYEGFGSSPQNKGETIKGKVIDIIDKLMNPEDETAKTIQSALTSSPGDYRPAPMSQVTLQQPNSAKKIISIRKHVPGKAGGGWESDDEDFMTRNIQSPSNATNESLEIIDGETGSDSLAEKQVITEFCKSDQWPVPLQSLHNVCQKCATLNCVNIIKSISDILQTESSSDVSKTRALLIVEWFLRTDLVAVTTMSNTLSPALDQVLLENSTTNKTVRVKSRKVKLIMDKLANRLY